MDRIWVNRGRSCIVLLDISFAKESYPDEIGNLWSPDVLHLRSPLTLPECCPQVPA